MFREPETGDVKSPSHIKAFSRIFAIVPTANGGFNIVNDMLSITNASMQQIDVRINFSFHSVESLDSKHLLSRNGAFVCVGGIPVAAIDVDSSIFDDLVECDAGFARCSYKRRTSE